MYHPCGSDAQNPWKTNSPKVATIDNKHTWKEISIVSSSAGAEISFEDYIEKNMYLEDEIKK